MGSLQPGGLRGGEVAQVCNFFNFFKFWFIYFIFWLCWDFTVAQTLSSWGEHGPLIAVASLVAQRGL